MRKLTIKDNTLPSNISITVHRENKRKRLFRWMYEVIEDFEYHICTFILATIMVDKYKKPVEFQLLGITALFLAAKMEETVCRSITEYVEVTDNSYTSAEILDMERDMLEYFDFDLNFVLPQNFIKDWSNKKKMEILLVTVCALLEKEQNMYYVSQLAKKEVENIFKGNISTEIMFYFERNKRVKELLNGIN